MPKVKNDREILNRNAQAEIDRLLKRKGIKKKDFGKFLGLGQSAGYRRYNDTGTLTLDDLRCMKLSISELVEIYGVAK